MSAPRAGQAPRAGVGARRRLNRNRAPPWPRKRVCFAAVVSAPPAAAAPPPDPPAPLLLAGLASRPMCRLAATNLHDGVDTDDDFYATDGAGPAVLLLQRRMHTHGLAKPHVLCCAA